MPSPEYIRCGDCDIAYLHQSGSTPTVLFCGGFRSDMRATKATAIARHCAARGLGCVRFDYSGHGESGGAFEQATIGAWLAQALAVVDQVAPGPLLLVGSSLGGWLAVLVARARAQRVHGLVTVAAAPDMTERLLRPGFSAAESEALARDGAVRIASDYDPDGYLITRALLDEGQAHCVLDAPLQIEAPVRLLHGDADRDVPWRLSLSLLERLTGSDARLTLVKNADHRFSSAANLALLLATVDELCA